MLFLYLGVFTAKILSIPRRFIINLYSCKACRAYQEQENHAECVKLATPSKDAHADLPDR